MTTARRTAVPRTARKAAAPSDPAVSTSDTAPAAAKAGPVKKATARTRKKAAPAGENAPARRTPPKKATAAALAATETAAHESKQPAPSAPPELTSAEEVTSAAQEPKLPATTEGPAVPAPGEATSTPATAAQEKGPDPLTAPAATAEIAVRVEPPAGVPVGSAVIARDEPLVGVPVEKEGRTAALARVLDHPGFAPELLALAAVEALGPRARAWADGLRGAYPDAGPDGLARLATRRFVRQAGLGGATAAVAGLFAPVVELAAVLWSQANLVLHLAAAYGRDPGHPDRAVELLVLTQIHADADSARAALDAARSVRDTDGEPPWPRIAEAGWRLAAPLAAQAGGWLALRLASRLLPGAAVLAAAAGDAAAADRLAARAVAAYRRPGRTASGGVTAS